MDTHRRPLAALGIVLLLLLIPLAQPAAAGPEVPLAFGTAYNTQRKLARTQNGTLYAAVTVNASGT